MKTCIDTQYATSMSHEQTIAENEISLTAPVTERSAEAEEFAKAIESTGGAGNVSKENQRIIHLFATGQIDYETAAFAIKKSFIDDSKVR